MPLGRGAGVRQPKGVNVLAAIASAAASDGLPFLVAGGHAVITHGFPRTTFDLDLIVRRGDREKWMQLGSQLGCELVREGPTFLQFSAAGDISFPLDLMIVNDDTFSKMQAESVPMPSTVYGLRVVSLMHLIALKCHAVKHGHPGRIVKDAEDVIRLAQYNKLNLDAPKIRELFQRHGTDEFYQKVRRAIRTDE